MSEPAGLEPPRGLEALLSEREALHRRRREAAQAAEGQAARLRAVPHSNGVDSPETTGPLTAEGTPPPELAAALSRLDERLAEIARAEAALDRGRTEIARLERRARLLVVTAAAVLVLALLLMVLALPR